MKTYTIDHLTIDFDEVFAYTDSNDDRLQLLFDKHIVKYRTKTIKAGNVLECEIYPIWDTHTSTVRARKTRESRDTQKRLNAKNALKRIIRLVNENFTDNDIWGTFTYETAKLPKTVEDAENDFANFLRRLRYHGRKLGFPPLKYVFWTEFEDDPKKGKKRVHHHIITNFPDRDLAEKLWRGGARTQTRRLQADESGYEGLVRYCMKDPKGKKRWKTSKNLREPQITIADCKFTRRKVNRLVQNEVEPQAVFEQMYRGYKMTQFTAKTSDYVTGSYIYVKMARRNPDHGRGKRVVHRE